MALGQELAAGEGSRQFFTAPGRQLAAARPNDGTSRAVQADFTLGSGTRRATSASPASTPCRITPTGPSAKRKLPGFTTQPLDKPLEIAGHPVVSLWLSSSEPDAAVFVYLSEVEADGTSRYVTEGVLRAIHRAEAPAPRNYRTTWPWRSYARKDARPMPAGEPQLLRFALLPTAWRFAAGSRLRLSIAGGDADHFVQTPHGRPPLLTLLNGGERASVLELPTERWLFDLTKTSVIRPERSGVEGPVSLPLRQEEVDYGGGRLGGGMTCAARSGSSSRD